MSTLLFVVLVGVVVSGGLLFRRYAKVMVSKVHVLERMVKLTDDQERIIAEAMSDTSELYDGRRSYTMDPIKVKFSSIHLHEKIGSGAFGDVWAGVYMGVDVAVKRMLSDRITVNNMEMFKREITLLRRVNHPNIIRFMGACWDPPNVLLLLELARGGSLHDRLSNQDLPPLVWQDAKLVIALEVAMGMKYLHSQLPPILHRDIKSHNVLLTGEGKVKLSDFGASREKVDTTMTSVGSQFWMPPEVFLGKRYNEKCDVYSYGILLCELGATEGDVKLVFRDVPFASIPVKVVDGWRPSLDGPNMTLPEGVQQLVKACCQEEMEHRPSFDQIERILESLLDRRWTPSTLETILTPVTPAPASSAASAPPEDDPTTTVNIRGGTGLVDGDGDGTGEGTGGGVVVRSAAAGGGGTEAAAAAATGGAESARREGEGRRPPLYRQETDHISNSRSNHNNNSNTSSSITERQEEGDVANHDATTHKTHVENVEGVGVLGGDQQSEVGGVSATAPPPAQLRPPAATTPPLPGAPPVNDAETLATRASLEREEAAAAAAAAATADMVQRLRLELEAVRKENEAAQARAQGLELAKTAAELKVKEVEVEKARLVEQQEREKNGEREAK